MKKVILFSFVLLMAYSCKNEDVTPGLSKSQVTGSWTLDYMWQNSSWNFIGIINWNIKFNTDGTYTSHETNDYSGTWKINGNNVVCQSGTVTVNYKVDSISTNFAIMEMSYPPSTDYIKFKVSK